MSGFTGRRSRQFVRDGQPNAEAERTKTFGRSFACSRLAEMEPLLGRPIFRRGYDAAAFPSVQSWAARATASKRADFGSGWPGGRPGSWSQACTSITRGGLGIRVQHGAARKVSLEIGRGDALEREMIEVGVQEGVEPISAESSLCWQGRQEQRTLLIGDVGQAVVGVTAPQVDVQDLIARLGSFFEVCAQVVQTLAQPPSPRARDHTPLPRPGARCRSSPLR